MLGLRSWAQVLLQNLGGLGIGMWVRSVLLGFFIFVLHGGCHIGCSGAVLSLRELSVRLQAAGAGAGKNSGGRVFV